LNCGVKNETIRNKPKNNCVNLCNPNFKESKLAMELLSKSSTPSNKSFNGKDEGCLDFRKNDNYNNNNFNLRLNQMLNSINDLKKKMNL